VELCLSRCGSATLRAFGARRLRACRASGGRGLVQGRRRPPGDGYLAKRATPRGSMSILSNGMRSDRIVSLKSVAIRRNLPHDESQPMESESLTVTLPENLSPALTEKLKALKPGTYCTHRSWGFGQIKEWDAANDNVTIDFKSKKGHLMQFIYAAESLTPQPGRTSHGGRPSGPAQSRGDFCRRL
jgi:hypothetical protein